MKKIHLLYTIILFTTLWGCKKDCDETYTITGKVMDATNNTPYSDTLFVLKIVEDKNLGGINKEILGTGHTNNNGEFTITYNCTDISGDIEFLLGNHEARLPRNQNITDKIIYFSPEGSFDIHVKLKAPIQPNDTFFVATLKGEKINDIKIDTFLNPKEGFFKNIRVPNKQFNMFWGRSSNSGNGKFIFIPPDGFDWDTPTQSINPSGDPYIDKLELEF